MSAGDVAVDIRNVLQVSPRLAFHVEQPKPYLDAGSFLNERRARTRGRAFDPRSNVGNNHNITREKDVWILATLLKLRIVRVVPNSFPIKSVSFRNAHDAVALLHVIFLCFHSFLLLL